MRRLKHLAFALVIMSTSLALAQAPRIEGAQKGSNLQSLAESGAFITIVIKGSGAEDPNLKVVESGNDYVTVVSESGQRHTYLFKSIASIRIQGQRVESEDWKPGEGYIAPGQQHIINRAIERANELFDAAAAEQNIKLDAAAMLSLAAEPSKQKEALEYIQQIHGSNDIPSALAAAEKLFIISRDDLINKSILDAGLASGNRQASAMAARLAGHMKYASAAPILNDMLKDRRAEICAPAAYALARLGQRDIEEDLLGLLADRNTEKGDAAVEALIMLGSDTQLLSRLESMLAKHTADILVRFRTASVLTAFGDAEGERILREEYMNVPTMRADAAMMLTNTKQDVEAMRALREILAQRFDPDEFILTRRAKMAAALIKANDPTALPIMQSVLRMDQFPQVQAKVCRLVTELGSSSVITIVQGALESPDTNVYSSACQAVLSMAYPSFRERLALSWK